MSDETRFSSPFLSEDISEPHSDYWVGRRKVAAAMRELIEAATVSDIPTHAVDGLCDDLQTLAARLREHRQLEGVIAYASVHGSLPVANHEILCVGGESHPMAPGLQHWTEGDVIRGRVQFNWSYEGPPGHVHGGWVAAIFDHFMGMAHMRVGKPGMTGGLDVRYHRPTPLNKPLDLEARVEPVSERKTRVIAELRCDGELTAASEALFIQPRSQIFTGNPDADAPGSD